MIHRTPSARRMTLVELLVAVALGMILIGVVTFVWIQSNKIFTTTVHRLDTYQRLRTVLDMMERDLANTTRTMDMEFFVDHVPPGAEEGNGYYDDADELLTVGGKVFREPRDPTDPLVKAGESEFGLPGFPPPDQPFLFAPTILSPPPYEIGAGYTDERLYWRDEVYVRSFVAIQGLNRPALIHYRLVQVEDGRSVLRRRVWFLDPTTQTIIPPDPTADPPIPGTDRVALLTGGVADFKVAFYFKPSPVAGEGYWYHVGDAGGTFSGDERATALVQSDEDRGFRTAYASSGGIMTNPFSGGENAISFVFQGNARIEQRQDEPIVLRPLVGDRTTDLETLTLSQATLSDDLEDYSPFDFPGVRPGDRILIYEATDDDDEQAPGAERRAKGFFPDRLFTVSEIPNEAQPDEPSVIGIRLREPIEFFRLTRQWLGVEEQINVSEASLTASGAPWAGPAGRTITASFNVRYRVGFLPAAFLIRISSDDRYNRKVLPMERVIRLVQQ